MENKLWNRHGFISQTLIIFSVTVLVVSGIGVLWGEDAREISTMYRLGEEGIGYETLLQFLFSSFCISAVEKVFYAERHFKRLLYWMRTACMLICVTVLAIIFIISFGWFSVDAWAGWVGFVITFGICFGVSTMAMVAKTKKESRMFEEKLEAYKERQKKQNEEKAK